MILVTSISPAHSNRINQHKSIESWNALGLECYSLNGEAEIDGLRKEYKGITFIETHRTLEKIYGKPLVSINAIIDFAIQQNKSLILVNSDIILMGLPKLNEDGITIMQRQDYSNQYENSQEFPHGFDFFYIPKELLRMFPPCMYGLGNCFFDFWIPVRAIEKNIPIYSPKASYAFHKLHDNHYSFQDWQYTAQMFRWEFKRNAQLDLGKMTTNTMQSIKNHLIYI